jgi:hypothetical protein
MLLTINFDKWNFIIAAAGFVVALVTAILATFLSVITYRLSFRMARNDLLFEVRAWGDEVVDLLSRAFLLCELNPAKSPAEFFEIRHELIHESSALLDRGRFFFPNVYKEQFGTNKPEAFRGIRPQILDLMKLVYELTRSIDYSAEGTNINGELRKAFIEVKRYFISIIQRAVDFRTVPSNATEYEQSLGNLAVPPIPRWVRTGIRADATFGELRWS